MIVPDELANRTLGDVLMANGTVARSSMIGRPPEIPRRCLMTLTSGSGICRSPAPLEPLQPKRLPTPPPASAAAYSDDVNAAAAAGPDAAAADNTPSDVAPGAAGDGIIAYPRNGQSDQQQATDKFQCHGWAKGQTGFDPTSQSSSGATGGVREAYGRAMAACLDARGYTVR